MKKSILMAFFLILMTSNVYAGPEITIVRGQDFPPYHFFDETDTESGFLIEIILSVSATMNMEVTFKQYPWSRCLEAVKKGRADAMMNLFKTKERLEFMYFSDNILAYEVNRFFKLKTVAVDYSGDLTALTSLKMGGIRNYSYGPEFDAMTFPRIFRLETEEDLIKSLINKRCDIIVGNETVIHLLKNRMGLDDVIESISPQVSKAPLYLGFSKVKKHKGLSEKFSSVLNQFKQTKPYTDILKKYGLQ